MDKDSSTQTPRDIAGRFKKGFSGNPGGLSKDNVSQLRYMRELVNPHIAELTQEIITKAKNGDNAMLRLCAEKFFPKFTDTVMPDLANIESYKDRCDALWSMTCEGNLSQDEFRVLTMGLAAAAKTEQITNLTEQVMELERIIKEQQND